MKNGATSRPPADIELNVRTHARTYLSGTLILILGMCSELRVRTSSGRFFCSARGSSPQKFPCANTERTHCAHSCREDGKGERGKGMGRGKSI